METNVQQGQGLEQQAITSTELPRKPKYLKKILYCLVILVLILALLYFFYPTLLSLFFGSDIPAQDYSGLQIETKVIPENVNAYYDLIKLGNGTKIYEPKFVLDYLAGKATWDQAVVADTWYKNQDYFPIFYAAVSKDKFQDPNTDQPEDLVGNEPIPFNAWRSMSRLSVIRAHYFLNHNQNKEAMEEALKSVKLGHIIQQSQSDLITFLVGTAIKTNGLQALEKIKTSLGNDDKTFLSSELKKYVDNTTGFISANKIEFLREAKFITDISQGIISDEYVSEDDKGEFKKLSQNNFYFKPNLTLSYYADLTRGIISKVNDCADIIYEQPLRFPDVGSSALKMKFMENAIGKTLFTVSDISLSSARQKLCDQRALVQKLTEN